MREDALQFGAEIDFAVLLVVVERLDAHAVAGQHQAALRLHPDGDGEHAAQAGERCISPVQKGLQDHFRIAMRVEDGAFAFQLLPQFDEVEDLAVVHDDGVAIFAEDGLVAASDIKNGQASSAQRDLFTFELRLLIGASMGDGVHRMSENAGWQGFTKV